MNPIPRQKARKFAVQAIYQWQITNTDINDIEKQFLNNDIKEPQKVDLEYFHELLINISDKSISLDETLQPFSSRPIAEVDPVELAVLRIATYELKNRLDIPYQVIINEALELTKTFGSEDGYKFVNGILDQVARQARKQDVA